MGQYHHFHLGVQVSDLGDRIETGEPRHRDVEENDVGPQLGDRFDRGTRISAVAHDLESFIAGEEAPEAGPDHALVVDEEDANHCLIGHRVCELRMLPSIR
jgi:hypothetical protein